jgi:hypothetical protein
MSARIFVLNRTIRPLAGRCPSCELPFDALGCRIVARRRTTGAERRRTNGARELIEVACRGVPAQEVLPCPCCTSHPGALHPRGEAS